MEAPMRGGFVIIVVELSIEIDLVPCMNLKLLKPYKSISSLEAIELPRFTVITGTNGSGKTHLLEAIQQSCIEIRDGEGAVKQGDIRLFNWNNLVPNEAKAISGDAVREARRQNWTKFKSYQDSQRTNLTERLTSRHQIGLGILPEGERFGINSLSRFIEVFPFAGENGYEIYRREISAHEKALRDKVKQQDDLRMLFFHGDLFLLDLTELEFFDLCSGETMIGSVFHQSFSQRFMSYHLAWDQNRYSRYLASVGEGSVPLSDEEFIEKFGEPPWEFLNKVIIEAGLNFCVNHPVGDRDCTFSLRLTNKDTGAEVGFGDLSSGERILMSFALCMYHAETAIPFPKVLLLDEIDAPLHPSMTATLLRVIQQILVDEKKIQVIFTTHSPSTIALAPESGVFRMERKVPRLTRTSISEAVQLLSAGLIAVTKNTRFVITEAMLDQLSYQAIFQALVASERIDVTPPLVFIRASDEKDQAGGGCSQVYSWASKLPTFGVTSILGLVDRDKGNQELSGVKVIGRYSVENYLVDPLLLYAALMEEDLHSEILDVGIQNCDIFEINNLSDNALQMISDAMVGRIQQFRPELNSVDRLEVTYANGKSINVPKWLIDQRGHDLVMIVIACFKNGDKPVFHKKLENVIRILSRKLTGFIPRDLVDIMKRLQNAP